MVLKHLICHSVYALEGERPSLIPGDGIELLTGYSPVQDSFREGALSVHLPYCTDWYSVWSGRFDVPDDIDDEFVRYAFYGRDRESIVESIRSAIGYAALTDPVYGVIHAGSANMNELLAQTYSDSDDDVLRAFAEAVNSAVADFPHGEPPFRLLFENQWWPGLRMRDGRNFKTLCDSLEFENWGLCLDTGHLLVSTQESRDECQAVELLLNVFDKYPKDMIDSVVTMHLHVNTSCGYIRRYPVPEDYYQWSLEDRLTEGYRFVCGMDQHLPFSEKCAVELVDYIEPDYVTHEISTNADGGFDAGYRRQRSLFCQPIR